MTIEELNHLGQPGFVDAVGWVFEHSPWVAERRWRRRPFGSLDDLVAAMTAELEKGTDEELLALLRAHPDLGSRARMTDASRNEQEGAGLDSLAPAEFARLHELNAAYRTKFRVSFPLCRERCDEARYSRSPRGADPGVPRGRSQRGVAPGAAHRPLSSRGHAFMNTFASGAKSSYYGKGDVIVYRLHRGGRVPAGGSAVFGASVLMLLYGEAFWPTYTSGDNTR
jgi:OHCU decarboxylase